MPWPPDQCSHLRCRASGAAAGTGTPNTPHPPFLYHVILKKTPCRLWWSVIKHDEFLGWVYTERTRAGTFCRYSMWIALWISQESEDNFAFLFAVCESWNACDPPQFQHQVWMVMKDLLSPSKCHVNIYNIHLDGGKKTSVTIQTLRWMVMKGLSPGPSHFGWAWKFFHNHPNTEASTETDADHKCFFADVVVPQCKWAWIVTACVCNLLFLWWFNLTNRAAAASSIIFLCYKSWFIQLKTNLY